MTCNNPNAQELAARQKRSYFYSNIKTYLPAIVSCVVLLVLGQVLSPGFASAKNISSILTQASILGIAAIGQAIVFFAGNSGIDLSMGATVTMGALFGAMVSDGKDSMIPVAILVIVLIGATIGLANGMGIQVLKVPALAMTLAMTAVVDGFTLFYTQGMPSYGIPETISSVGRPLLGQLRPVMIIVLALIVAMEFIMRKSSFGRSIYLIGSNRKAAQLCGISVNITAIMAYVISGIFAALCGYILVGYTGSGQITMGNSYTMSTISAVVIGGVSVAGGRGTFIGAALGCIVLILLQSVLVALGLQAGVRTFFQGLILILVLIANCRDAKLRQ